MWNQNDEKTISGMSSEDFRWVFVRLWDWDLCNIYSTNKSIECIVYHSKRIDTRALAPHAFEMLSGRVGGPISRRGDGWKNTLTGIICRNCPMRYDARVRACAAVLIESGRSDWAAQYDPSQP